MGASLASNTNNCHDMTARRKSVAIVTKAVPHYRIAFFNGLDARLKMGSMKLTVKGVTLVGPLSVAPELGLAEGLVAGSNPPAELQADMERAAEAARAIGKLDIGQAAAAVDGRVVALEGAEGTDGLLKRIAELRVAGRIAKSGGVLVKCMKPAQDPRLDLPGIGPRTAAAARRAGLDGVAGEAGRALLVGRAETIAAFEEEGLFLVGIPHPPDDAGIDKDV